MVTGDLDEYAIAALAAAPVDGYGVGTSLVTGSGAPTAALVYKLVARAIEGNGDGELRPVAKRSVGKPSRGGRKWAIRQLDEQGTASAEVITTDPAPQPAERPLLRLLVRRGEIVGREPLPEARERHRQVLAELPPTRRSCPAATRRSRPSSGPTTGTAPRRSRRPAPGRRPAPRLPPARHRRPAPAAPARGRPRW